MIANYSHGMKEKLALTAAFMNEPQLLILDEPFVGLDPIARKNLKDLMHERTIAGGAIIFSTHVLAVAEKLCDKVVILKNGEIIIEGAILTSCYMESPRSSTLDTNCKSFGG